MLASVPRLTNPNVLVGYDTSDDAGVYRLGPDLALVQTVDFFTPIVDDPFTFGAIAAANALSDIYAMGGKPLTSLSIVCFPGEGEIEDLEEILKGGAEKMREADCIILGGHSVNDEEIKFGYAVTGTVHPERVRANASARAGDVIVFTKRLGTGVIGTALKRGIAQAAHVEDAVESMLTLNRQVCEASVDLEVHGCTDITGFGFIGHLRELALASRVTCEVDVERLQSLPGALDYIRQGAVPGGLKNNIEFASCAVEPNTSLDPTLQSLLYDPQTSGGLLMTLCVTDADRLVERYPRAYRVGRVAERGSFPIRLI